MLVSKQNIFYRLFTPLRHTKYGNNSRRTLKMAFKCWFQFDVEPLYKKTNIIPLRNGNVLNVYCWETLLSPTLKEIATTCNYENQRDRLSTNTIGSSR